MCRRSGCPADMLGATRGDIEPPSEPRDSLVQFRSFNVAGGAEHILPRQLAHARGDTLHGALTPPTYTDVALARAGNVVALGAVHQTPTTSPPAPRPTTVPGSVWVEVIGLARQRRSRCPRGNSSLTAATVREGTRAARSAASDADKARRRALLHTEKSANRREMRRGPRGNPSLNATAVGDGWRGRGAALCAAGGRNNVRGASDTPRVDVICAGPRDFCTSQASRSVTRRRGRWSAQQVRDFRPLLNPPKSANRRQMRRGPRLKFSLIDATFGVGEGVARSAALAAHNILTSSTVRASLPLLLTSIAPTPQAMRQRIAVRRARVRNIWASSSRMGYSSALHGSPTLSRCTPYALNALPLLTDGLPLLTDGLPLLTDGLPLSPAPTSHAQESASPLALRQWIAVRGVMSITPWTPSTHPLGAEYSPLGRRVLTARAMSVHHSGAECPPLER
ncbi:uncharacterized protein SCHCODRAFT_01161156 [Schizophyllum commune H4-8]|uniref:uncharacterized protein n=1 Tax=Schizophyllum commune (strain H4-8 / FGSC 9210) TaxID=578458 RepID=UPI00216024AD|nr:uncharacterized protein SCHCODRAFT_01161156 [Schizophyllum commune H4-8]KAI5886917.1 hypothetical protein SCHCODRAFT_01161156 [Schizophyllum commune H4-8]